jgi:hypothetical protein
MEQYLCVGGVEIINRCRDISLIIGGEHPAAPPKILSSPRSDMLLGGLYRPLRRNAAAAVMYPGGDRGAVV